MFHSTLGLKSNTGFGGVFELDNVEQPQLEIAQIGSWLFRFDEIGS